MPYWIFHFFAFRFVLFCYISFRFDRFHFVLFDFVSFGFVRTLQIPVNIVPTFNKTAQYKIVQLMKKLIWL
jgi:hypothetical protein